MQKSFFSLLCATLVVAGSAKAQAPLDCPAPVQEGTWTVTDGAGFVTARTADGAVSLALKGNSVAQGQMQNLCDGTFVLRGQSEDGIPITLVMEPQPLTDDEPRRYVGSDSHMMFRLTLDLTLTTESAARGTFALDASGGGASMSSRIPVTMLASGAEVSAPAACGCRPQLEAFIDREVAKQSAIRDLYADANMRYRPPDYEPGLFWDPVAYDYLVQLRASGVAPDRAVEMLEEAVLGGDIVKGEEPDVGDLTAEGRVKVLGFVDQETCDVTIGTAHLSSCYPEILRGAIERHEDHHAAQCVSRQESRLPEPGYYEAVDSHADEEVAAYTAGIDFLSGWIAENCGG